MAKLSKDGSGASGETSTLTRPLLCTRRSRGSRVVLIKKRIVIVKKILMSLQQNNMYFSLTAHQPYFAVAPVFAVV